MPGGVAPKFGSEKVSRYTGVSQLQLRVSRYTVRLRKRNPEVPQEFSRSDLTTPEVVPSVYGKLDNPEDRNLLKLRSLDPSCPLYLSDHSIWGP